MDRDSTLSTSKVVGVDINDGVLCIDFAHNGGGIEGVIWCCHGEIGSISLCVQDDGLDVSSVQNQYLTCCENRPLEQGSVTYP